MSTTAIDSNTYEITVAEDGTITAVPRKREVTCWEGLGKITLFNEVL